MSPDTVHFIKRGQLQDDAVYRATYLEYDTDVPETHGMTSLQLLEWLFGQEDLLVQANQQLRTLSAEYPEDSHLCQAQEHDHMPASAHTGEVLFRTVSMQSYKCFFIIILVSTPNLPDTVLPLKYTQFSKFNANVAPV